MSINKPQKAYGLTISPGGETGGERPQKTGSKFDPLQTSGARAMEIRKIRDLGVANGAGVAPLKSGAFHAALLCQTIMPNNRRREMLLVLTFIACCL
jgi:hypothetical protein